MLTCIRALAWVRFHSENGRILCTTLSIVFLFHVSQRLCYCIYAVLYLLFFPLSIRNFEKKNPFRQECFACAKFSSGCNEMLYMCFVSFPWYCYSGQTPNRREKKHSPNGKGSFEQANAIRLKNDATNIGTKILFIYLCTVFNLVFQIENKRQYFWNDYNRCSKMNTHTQTIWKN